ncbi:hypothetical protein KCTC52924_03337 [Arenibacter antarcticus]|nr:hypothetical protein [Arenibacter sp. H213]
MIRKNYIILAVFWLMATLSVSAQGKPDWDKIKSYKIAFITERLNLTPKEAQDFWPLYNEYEAQKIALHRREHSKIKEKIKNLDALSAAEASDLLKQMGKLEEDKYRAEKAYIEKVSNTISAKKAIVLLRSEEDFKRQLIKQYRQKRGEK